MQEPVTGAIAVPGIYDAVSPLDPTELVRLRLAKIKQAPLGFMQ